MDAYTFTFWPSPDMFEFFEQGRGEINPRYWAEKQGVKPGLDGPRLYYEDRFRALVRAWYEERAAEMDEDAAAELLRVIDWELLGDDVACTEDTAQAALREFEYDPALREASWEWDLREYDHHYLWCCWAIVAGIKQYRAAKAEA